MIAPHGYSPLQKKRFSVFSTRPKIPANINNFSIVCTCSLQQLMQTFPDAGP